MSQLIFFSDPGGPTTNTAADWQDNVSGLTNKIVIAANDNDDGVALAQVSGGLCILMKYSIHLLTGSGSSSFAVRQVIAGIGCTDRDSVCEVNGAVLFMSQNGLMRFDGAQLENISDPIRSLLQQYSTASYSITALPEDYIALSVFHESGGLPTTHRVLALYHLPSRSWVEASILPYQPFLLDRVEKEVIGVTSAAVVYLESLVQPYAGSSGNGYDRDGSGNYRGIQAEWHSRIFSLASPTHRAQLHRLIFDYLLQAGDTQHTWQLSVYNGSGSLLAGPFTLSHDSGIPNLMRQRDVRDVFHEANEVQLRLTQSTTTPATSPPASVPVAEFFNAHVEYQLGTPSRSY